MNQNDITTEIELPGKKKDTNIIHVNFTASQTPPPPRRNTRRRPVPVTQQSFASWLGEFDVRAPWVLRLVAVVSVLILSMLIL